MISAILLVNRKGEILILRAYKDNVSRAENQQFCTQVVSAKEAGERPITNFGTCHFIHITEGEITVVASTKDNVNAVLVLRLLYKTVEVLKAYFGGTLDEAQVRKNFVLIYELLDEIIDYGYPQILEVDILKKYVTQGNVKGVDLTNEEQLKKVMVQATGSCSWRAEGIKYRKNEVYIDVIESVHVLLSNKGTMLRADVSGQIMVKCLLSGMPECKFGMNDKLVMTEKDSMGGGGMLAGGRGAKTPEKGIAIDDYRFHQCVKLSKFDTDRAITFVPPDGVFELMSYRITEQINLPFKVLPVVQERGRNRVECSVKIKSMYERNIFATNVVVKIPCPRHTAKAVVQSLGAGKAKYEPSQQAILWRIRRFSGGDVEYTLFAEIELAATVSEKQWTRPPISMDFQVPMFTASGLRVRFLRVQEKSNYKPVKWIRYITKAGSYQHRI